MQNRKPNTTVKLVFEEVETDDHDLKALKIYVEAEGRDIDPELMIGDEATLAEVWATEVLGFVEDYMKSQIESEDINGLVMTMPVKKDMN